MKKENYREKISSPIENDFLLLEKLLGDEKREPIKIYISILLGKTKRFPIHYWDNNEEKIAMVVNWLLVEYLKVPLNEIPKVVCQAFFRKYKLFGILNGVCGCSTFDLIDLVYPEKYNAWEFNKVPCNYWDDENIIAATKWLVEEKLKLDIGHGVYITRKEFRKHGLNFFDTGENKLTVKKVLMMAYPNKIKEWA